MLSGVETDRPSGEPGAGHLELTQAVVRAFPLEGVRVLVADDDELFSRHIARSLARAGAEVHRAEDGSTAVHALENADFDILLLDWYMPGMDGGEVLRVLPLLRDNTPLTFVLSGSVDVGRTVRAMRGGASDVIEKPVDSDELIARLLAGLGRQRGIPGAEPTSILGRSAAIRTVREQVRRVATFADVTVLITGDTGTGKELVAHACHDLSAARHEPFVAVNCAAIPDQLLESELFGHEAGSFTGARGARRGLLESAGKGTVFMDEIGEMPLPAQAKLLRALETRRFRRVGSNRELPFEARIVSATNRVLTGADAGRMRSDLYYRLAGFTIHIAPLRDRPEDIDELAESFLTVFAERHPGVARRFTPQAIQALHAHDWPGNVRELRAVVHQAAVCATAGTVGVASVEAALSGLGGSRTSQQAPIPSEVHPIGVSDWSEAVPNLPALERDVILKAYANAQQNVAEAARMLGMPRTTLRDKLRRFGVR